MQKILPNSQINNLYPHATSYWHFLVSIWTQTPVIDRPGNKLSTY